MPTQTLGIRYVNTGEVRVLRSFSKGLLATQSDTSAVLPSAPGCHFWPHIVKPLLFSVPRGSSSPGSEEQSHPCHPFLSDKWLQHQHHRECMFSQVTQITCLLNFIYMRMFVLCLLICHELLEVPDCNAHCSRNSQNRSRGDASESWT